MRSESVTEVPRFCHRDFMTISHSQEAPANEVPQTLKEIGLMSSILKPYMDADGLERFLRYHRSIVA